MRLWILAFAAFLATSPLCGAMAQQTTSPTVGADSGKGSNAVKKGAAPNMPGGTGTTVVPGSNSTVAGDRTATADAKTGSNGTGSSGGGK